MSGHPRKTMDNRKGWAPEGKPARVLDLSSAGVWRVSGEVACYVYDAGHVVVRTCRQHVNAQPSEGEGIMANGCEYIGTMSLGPWSADDAEKWAKRPHADGWGSIIHPDENSPRYPRQPYFSHADGRWPSKPSDAARRALELACATVVAEWMNGREGKAARALAHAVTLRDARDEADEKLNGAEDALKAAEQAASRAQSAWIKADADADKACRAAEIDPDTLTG